ncbi:MAG: nucleotidyltransferase domain-containing protein [Bacteroidaceae bacterium]|nr:nucleotidyltransferase domain-containing protein [Bacteroidaceae bacterium]
MITRKQCIDTIKANAETIIRQYDVRSLRLFGSLARNEQQEGSDVDVCVEMPPDMFQLIGLKQYLEELVGCEVDVVRVHRNIDDFLMKNIERDGIYIIREASPNMAYA